MTKNDSAVAVLSRSVEHLQNAVPVASKMEAFEDRCSPRSFFVFPARFGQALPGPGVAR